MTHRISIPLDGLGMDEKAMLELINRLNANDDRKWVLEHATYIYVHSSTTNVGSLTPYRSVCIPTEWLHS